MSDEPRSPLQRQAEQTMANVRRAHEQSARRIPTAVLREELARREQSACSNAAAAERLMSRAEQQADQADDMSSHAEWVKPKASNLPEPRDERCTGGCTFPVIDFDSDDERISVCGQDDHGSKTCVLLGMVKIDVAPQSGPASYDVLAASRGEKRLSAALRPSDDLTVIALPTRALEDLRLAWEAWDDEQMRQGSLALLRELFDGQDGHLLRVDEALPR